MLSVVAALEPPTLSAAWAPWGRDRRNLRVQAPDSIVLLARRRHAGQGPSRRHSSGAERSPARVRLPAL